ncbi:MAG: formylglycine-generating enzyme family protein [Cephaloticoccus sp.]|nr:formylglycine-generating enzyme family protein [Akkermansiaceae bacterium]MCF7761979.1 formylglycine-generating enzyme family protein [Cephaloticoccus sp.]
MHALIPAPENPAVWPAWRDSLQHWRQSVRELIHYDSSAYDRPEFAWARRNYLCYFLMMTEQAWFDHAKGRFDVARFLGDMQTRYGGVDSVLLWNAYPCIGIDPRNQYDLYRDWPGGLGGVRAMVDALHAAGVRTFVSYQPWDTGTQREPAGPEGGKLERYANGETRVRGRSKSDFEALADLVAATGVDGVFLDTMTGGDAEMRRRLDAVRPGITLNPECVPAVESLASHHMSWGQAMAHQVEIPGVLRSRWFERRHLQYETNRFSYDLTDELHTAWMNGSGMLIWENMFCTWTGHNARFASLLRSLAPILRRFSEVFSSEDWTPLVPTGTARIYASQWRLAQNELRLWTVVNRDEAARAGDGPACVKADGFRYFDLVLGREIQPVTRGETQFLPVQLRGRGATALLALPTAAVTEEFKVFLTQQAATDARADWDTTGPTIPERLTPVPVLDPTGDIPPGMVEVRAGETTLRVRHRRRESGFYTGANTERLPYQWDWDGCIVHTQGVLERPAQWERFAIDRFPVTNADYARFLAVSGYRPKQSHGFLRHWLDGVVPGGLENHPVVQVDLNDARAYAAWAGKRLPTEEEWWAAAGGMQGRHYPWGDTMAENRCNSGRCGGTTPVDAFPLGVSPAGCWDMCGNVWELTESERNDGHTRQVILKGGSWFDAPGSMWYMEGGPRPNDWSTKFCLAWAGLDRASTIGFRCVVPLE